MRLRPVAEALVAAKKATPSLDIKVYLDQQEWISISGDAAQKAEVAACEAAATTPTALRNCRENDFLFSKALVDAGIDLRYKIYSYRWDHSFAAQMHSKYMIVDGTELLSGSYNLSMNAEHSTFENVIHLSGAQFRPMVDKFEQNFASIFATGPDLLSGLRSQISTNATIPLVFPSMSLSWQQYNDLKILIRQNCTVVDSVEFRSNAAGHKTCQR
jgi:phosphatidylserine/phosphatidylglycerophosphate/cardiolipin synthase-like enzyme